ncbi:hypothetical protein HPB48_012063 [Haemaphysalis longicornis]|uniref:Uncharacterized protein n=1 Tax=Haemaphysalis longicornis TaxID=44386 RepID=A0A9J6GV44_HAELO|nr:hypothetical protein HPB48_012063 [Haemaphysalis longicornis]
MPLDDWGQHSRCTLFANPSDPYDTRLVTYQAWSDDMGLAPTSIVSSWDLVFGRAWLIPLANALSMAGALVTLSMSGFVADCIGRKMVAVGAATTLLIAEFGSSFATSCLVYMITKFLMSSFCTTLFIASVVLLVKVSTHGNRAAHVGFSASAGLSLGDVAFAVASQLPHEEWMIRPDSWCPDGPDPRRLPANHGVAALAHRQAVIGEVRDDHASRGKNQRLPVGWSRATGCEAGRLRTMSTPSLVRVRDVDTVCVICRCPLTSFCALFSALFTYYVFLLACATRTTALMMGVPLATSAIACPVLLRTVYCSNYSA